MKSILAVQSHVVHGYVGNKAATFPLQVRGWDVDALNSVEFSNHTGYGSFHGRRSNSKELLDIYQGLKDQGFDYNALLTGYLPSADCVRAVAKMAADLRHRFPELVWCLDPVLGDEGKLYVSEDVVPAYREVMSTGIATIITPNDFEVELLTGIKLVDESSIMRALRVFHEDWNIPFVTISSLARGDDLVTIGSSRDHGSFTITVQRFDSYFTGTGDLFAALMVDNFCRYSEAEYPKAVAATLETLRAILERTWSYSRLHHAGRVKMADPNMRYHELRLVDCLEQLMDTSPPKLECVPFHS